MDVRLAAHFIDPGFSAGARGVFLSYHGIRLVYCLLLGLALEGPAQCRTTSQVSLYPAGRTTGEVSHTEEKLGSPATVLLVWGYVAVVSAWMRDRTMNKRWVSVDCGARFGPTQAPEATPRITLYLVCMRHFWSRTNHSLIGDVLASGHS
jgi:hypothetical protein